MGSMCHSFMVICCVLSDLPLPSLPRVYDTEAEYYLTRPDLNRGKGNLSW